jgi:hypothetical protein
MKVNMTATIDAITAVRVLPYQKLRCLGDLLSGAIEPFDLLRASFFERSNQRLPSGQCHEFV